MKAYPTGYLWSKYECFLMSGCQDMDFYIGKIAAHSAYNMFHGISAWLLVWFFPTSVFGVGISFWLRLFLIFAYLYLFLSNLNASVTRTGTRTETGTGTWTTGVTAIALCTSCSQANYWRALIDFTWP